ncbi:hypothetical protein PCY08_05455 [Streptococcus sp. SO4]|uniref:DUF6287 domain-containing protein n=1 Tax=Streptococcus sp. SO4 TaxID=3018249 RepID=UPI00263E2DF7|nr:DUF6287 domain-containing protein [Streptococcus sp. SO4]MDN5024885.1 hypothetical protein [Streptococcus sp. SO4]
MNKKERMKHVEKTHGRKATASKLAKASSTTKNIKMYIGLALTALVIIIVASIFLNSSNLKQEANQTSSSSKTEETTKSQGKENDKDKAKEEEIQKLKEQLSDLDTKISESEQLVNQFKKEASVPKLDIEAIRNNDLSSLEGTWRTQSGNGYVINDSGEVQSSWIYNDQKHESIVELKVSKSQNDRNPETVALGAWAKGSQAGGFVVVVVPSGVVMEPGDDGKITDNSNHTEDRLFAGQQYEGMLMHPENVYYRVKPDTTQLESEEKNLTKLKTDRDAIKSALESKEK